MTVVYSTVACAVNNASPWAVLLKFEVFIHYGSTNDSAKCIKMGQFGWFWVIQGHQQCHHLIERTQLFDYNRNYA